MCSNRALVHIPCIFDFPMCFRASSLSSRFCCKFWECVPNPFCQFTCPALGGRSTHIFSKLRFTPPNKDRQGRGRSLPPKFKKSLKCTDDSMPVQFNGVWVFNLISIKFDGFCLIQNVCSDAPAKS